MRLKQGFIILLIFVFAFSAVACSTQPSNTTQPSTDNASSSNDTNTNNSSGSNNSDTTAKKEDEKDKKYTITGMTFRYGDPPPKDGVGLKMINERFNVDYQPEIIPQADYMEKSSAIVAAGDMPDIIGFQGNDQRFHQWAAQGAFLPLDDYIDKFPTLGGIQKHIWNAFKKDGKIYGIPRFSAPYPLTPIIRKDWLDNLGLVVPTSYEELKEVAIAFTKDDPDQNGKNDTYGIAIGQNINPNFNMGAYWDFNAWYHQDENGNFLPGIISEGRKELVQFFADLYKEGAMTRDFAVLNWADTNKEFYSGKAGIFIGAVSGMSVAYMEGLLEINPGAEFVAIPPFKAPDGSQGFTMGSGYSGILALNAKLAGDEGKIHRVLELVDYGKTYYPKEQRGPHNSDFDWSWGKEGVGYNMENGIPVLVPTFSSEGLSPLTYFLDNIEQKAPDYDYADGIALPQLKAVVADLQSMFKNSNMYLNPVYGIQSQTEIQKGADLLQYMMNEQSKMIAGQRPVSDWDKLVEEYMSKGGAQIIQEINAGIKANGITSPQWD